MFYFYMFLFWVYAVGGGLFLTVAGEEFESRKYALWQRLLIVVIFLFAWPLVVVLALSHEAFIKIRGC